MTDSPSIISTIAYDPTSGDFRLRVAAGGVERWSQPMSLRRIENLLKDEWERRVRDGQQQSFYAQSIPADALLAAGVFTPEAKRIPESHPKLIAAKRRQADIEASIMDESDILRLVLGS